MMIRKRPGERLDYTIEFGSWLSAGDILATATVSENTGVVVDDIEIIGDTVSLWLFGGEPETSYQLKLFVVTAEGRRKTQCIQVRNQRGAADPIVSGIITASSKLWVYANFTLNGDTA